MLRSRRTDQETGLAKNVLAICQLEHKQKEAIECVRAACIAIGNIFNFPAIKNRVAAAYEGLTLSLLFKPEAYLQS